MSFEKIQAEHYRITILRLLSDQDDRIANAQVLQDGMELFGHKIPRDRVIAELEWLRDEGLVRLERPGTGLVVAELTRDGEDVAMGRKTVEGVRRPSAK